MRHYRLRGRECLRVAADHHGQDALLRTRLAARYGRVEKLKACGARGLLKFTRDVGGDRRMIHVNRALAHAGECAVGAERDRTQVVVVADARNTMSAPSA